MNKLRTYRNLANLRQGRNDWYRITAKADGPAEVMIYDEIGYFGITAQDFIRDMSEIAGPVSLHLNSPGGEVFDGIAIYNYLADRGGVTTVVDGLAASICSVIAQAGGRRVVKPNSTMMIHDGIGMAIGSSADMTEMAALLDKASDNIASIYASRSGQPQDGWRAAMRAETWYVGQEAVDAGLADEMSGGKVSTQNTWDLSIFRPVNASVDDSPWDASKAWAAGAASGDPAAFYNGICAGKKAGDPATQAAHALPHHYHPADAPNEAGVRNALARLPQTSGLINEAAAKAHLQAHMSAISPGGDDGSSNHADLDLDQLTSALKEALS